MNKACEYQGYYLDWDDEFGERDVLKCKLFTNEGIWNEYCYCDEKERNDCMLYKYSKFIEAKDKEIERLNSIIKEAINIYEDCCKMEDFATCDLDMYEILKRGVIDE